MIERTSVTFDGFVHADGESLVDGRGRPLLMRGVGLGNWLLPEGYMWRFPSEVAQSPRAIEALVEELIGTDAAKAFWLGFRESFIAEADIERIAAEGFDHVRLPMSSRLLLDRAGDLRLEGLEPIDRLIAWCRKHGLWVVLDLHAAPGGQTGTNIDDSPRSLPDLFLVGGAYRERTIGLWVQLAEHYRDETVVAGYDLLNEPLPHEYGERFGPDLVSLYRDVTAAIRAIDPNHLLIYEGTRWSTDWSIFTEVWDPNSMLQFHKYWSAPDRPSVAAFVEKGDELSLPIYMGEGGENHLAWIQTAFGLFEDLGISWNFWPWKKMETWNSPASVVPPDGWSSIVDYAARHRPRPTAAEAQGVFDDLLERVRLDACEYRSDVVRALFHRVPTRLAAESFGFGGQGVSYGVREARPLDWFRGDDSVTIRSLSDSDAEAVFGPVDAPDGAAGSFEVVIGEGEWLEYSVEVAEPASLVLRLDLGAAGTRRSCLPAVTVDGACLRMTEHQGRARWVTSEAVRSGPHTLRIVGRCQDTAIRSLGIELGRA